MYLMNLNKVFSHETAAEVDSDSCREPSTFWSSWQLRSVSETWCSRNLPGRYPFVIPSLNFLPVSDVSYATLTITTQPYNTRDISLMNKDIYEN